MNAVFEIINKKFLQEIGFVMLLTVLIQPVVIAQAGITWTSRATPAAGVSWNAVAYGKGKFVAVGIGGVNSVMTSPDGITWTMQSALSGNWASVTYGNGVFVAVAPFGTNQVMTSPDGINWTNNTPATITGSWQGVTWGNPNGQSTFVAVSDANGGGVMTSPDGVNWTSQVPAGSGSWVNITYGNNTFVAVAYFANGTADEVMTSADGINWVNHTAASDNIWNSVAWGNPNGQSMFVAVAPDGGLMSSTDGINWTHQTPAANNGWTSVTYGNNLFVAVGFSGAGNRVMTSPDGINWTIQSSAADNTWLNITYANGLFVAVSNDGTNRVMTSGTFISLPVHWLNVAGEVNNQQQATIKWTVAELSTAKYEIEKSLDGIVYNKIGDVSARGDGENSYSFTEQQPLTSTTWYRVKQTDNDGKFSYSSVVLLHSGNDFQKSVYPNPAEGQATVLVDKSSLNKTAILTDMQGKTLQTIKISSLSFMINVADYPAGCYLLKIENESPVKIVKR